MKQEMSEREQMLAESAFHLSQYRWIRRATNANHVGLAFVFAGILLVSIPMILAGLSLMLCALSMGSYTYLRDRAHKCKVED